MWSGEESANPLEPGIQNPESNCCSLIVEFAKYQNPIIYHQQEEITQKNFKSKAVPVSGTRERIRKFSCDN